MKQSIIITAFLFSLILLSCTKESPGNSMEIEEGNFSSLIINQDWSANYIINYETETVYEGYFVFHFLDDGFFFIDAYDTKGNEINYPIIGGQYVYMPGSNHITVDFRKVGQNNPFWPKVDKWDIIETDLTLEGMPNPYHIEIIANNSRLMTDLFPGNILKYKNIQK